MDKYERDLDAELTTLSRLMYRLMHAYLAKRAKKQGALAYPAMLNAMAHVAVGCALMYREDVQAQALTDFARLVAQEYRKAKTLEKPSIVVSH